MLLALVLAAAAAPFFADPLVPAALGPIDPRPGSWAEYLVRTRGREDVRVRATALAAEGQRRYWLELTAAGESGIAWAAIQRLMHPEPAGGITMVAVATCGVVINGATALLFAAGRKGDLNVTQAQHIRRLPSARRQAELARYAADEGMSAAQIGVPYTS